MPEYGKETIMIGLQRKTMRLVPHDPSWHDEYLKERERIITALGDRILSLEHIGSTSINGIFAKPIIDMAVGVKSFDDGFACIAPLESIGYLFVGESGVPGRHYFRTNSEFVLHHIHMFAIDSQLYANHILFRDYMNTHPDDAQAYSELKLSLWKKNLPREEYTEAKAPFIEEVLEKARKWKV